MRTAAGRWSRHDGAGRVRQHPKAADKVALARTGWADCEILSSMALRARAWFMALLFGCGAEAHDPGADARAALEGQDAGVDVEPSIEGCEDALLDDLPDAPACNTEQRCALAATQPGDAVYADLFVSESARDEQGNYVSISVAAVDRRVACLARYAEALGLQPVPPSPGEEWITVEAPFAEVEPLLRKDIVVSYTLDCSERFGTCPHCGSLDEAGCAAEPHCFARLGTLFGEANACTDDLFAGCMRGGSPCGDSWVWATAPDGGWFSNTCIPEGFVESYCDSGGRLSCSD
jgi:hypothetical protein